MKWLISQSALVMLSACTYDPPPEVNLLPPAQKHFVVGEVLVLEFTEPVCKRSLEIVIWPGSKDLYTVEGELRPEVGPVVALCKATDEACGEDGGVKLTLAGGNRRAEIEIAGGAVPLGEPLVLEVTGELADLHCHKKGVAVSFDFQIVSSSSSPDSDIVEGDGGHDVTEEPLGVEEGGFLFFAEFEQPMKLPQQFWSDLQVNQETGRFVILMTDGDPIDGAPSNTAKPEELNIDTGDEGFIFTVTGEVRRNESGGLTFEGEPFTLGLSLGPITFEIRDAVVAGSIVDNPVTGLSVWDGTMVIKELYLATGASETTYPSDQANFQMTQLTDTQIPDDMPLTCEPDPCSKVGGSCDLLGEWPPAEVCEE